MNPNSVLLTLFLYSKYSESSKYLMQYLMNANFIQKLCIDNPEVKKQVLNSKIQITKIPCIIVYHSLGTVELFEGTKAFEWIHYNVTPIFAPPQPVYEPPPPQEYIQNPQNPQDPQQHIQNPVSQSTSTPIEMISQEEEEEKKPSKTEKRDNVKSRAEELERARNETLFNKENNPQISGMKPGGPMNDNMTSSIRQR